MSSSSHLCSHYSSHSGGSGSRALPSTIRPEKSEDWEPYRAVVTQLYSDMKLKDVMAQMQATYGFKATEKQYKTQIKKWNLDTKYTKASEYVAMIKTQKKREMETPGKQTKFTLRGRPVDPKDIARFEKRATKKGGVDFEAEGDEYIEDLVYETPSPTTSVTGFQQAGQESESYGASPAQSYTQPTTDDVGSIGYLLSYDHYPSMDTGERAMLEYQRRQ